MSDMTLRLTHSVWHDGGYYTREPCEILRVTAKRIYFRTPSISRWISEQKYSVDRAAIEAAGRVYHRRLREDVYLERDGAEGESNHGR